MNSHPKLSCAIAAILNGSAAGYAYAGPAVTSDASSDGIQEITVTAQRRVENNQDVPIQIQALTAETLVQLNVATFDDFVRYLPNVATASQGPGQGNIYMRGLGTTSDGSQGSGGVGQVHRPECCATSRINRSSTSPRAAPMPVTRRPLMAIPV